jgi:hypothetical protein
MELATARAKQTSLAVMLPAAVWQDQESVQ